MERVLNSKPRRSGMSLGEPHADGGDSPAWSRKRGVYQPPEMARGGGSVRYAELHAHSAYSFLDGASMPEAMVQRLHAVAHDPAEVRRVGVELATELSVKVLQGGAPGLQFFTLNRSRATSAILANLRALGLDRRSPAAASDE